MQHVEGSSAAVSHVHLALLTAAGAAAVLSMLALLSVLRIRFKFQCSYHSS
jgi:hypothetical protein